MRKILSVLQTVGHALYQCQYYGWESTNSYSKNIDSLRDKLYLHTNTNHKVTLSSELFHCRAIQTVKNKQ